MTDRVDVPALVIDALETADQPLSAGGIQRRIASQGVDVATGAIRDACEELAAAGDIETVGREPRSKYRLDR